MLNVSQVTKFVFINLATKPKNTTSYQKREKKNKVPAQEDGPISPGLFAVLGDDLLLVVQPVLVPGADRQSVVDTLVSNRSHFPASTLDLVNVPVQRARSVGTGEDVPEVVVTVDLEDMRCIST